MKYLKIENNKGYYYNETGNWQEIDKINKHDLTQLLNAAIDSEFEMDNYENASMNNKAHQIIYKNIYGKFIELLENKNRFKDESEQLYKTAFEKYQSINIQNETKDD